MTENDKNRFELAVQGRHCATGATENNRSPHEPYKGYQQRQTVRTKGRHHLRYQAVHVTGRLRHSAPGVSSDDWCDSNCPISFCTTNEGNIVVLAKLRLHGQSVPYKVDPAEVCPDETRSPS